MSKPFFRNGLADLQIGFDEMDLRGGDKLDVSTRNWCSEK
jgi:hypothetical protein